jgi:hypothetical protein
LTEGVESRFAPAVEHKEARWPNLCGESIFFHRRSIDVTDAQLDALEVRGYLDPSRRGDRADECDAIEMFLADSLNKR